MSSNMHRCLTFDHCCEAASESFFIKKASRMQRQLHSTDISPLSELQTWTSEVFTSTSKSLHWFMIRVYVKKWIDRLSTTCSRATRLLICSGPSDHCITGCWILFAGYLLPC